MDESKRNGPVDLARIDAHVISELEYEEIPELTDEDFARGTWMPGHAKAPQPTVAQHLLIDADVLARFRATGLGWELRINRVLREAADALRNP